MVTGFFPFRVSFTAFKCVFMLISTPVIVPWTTVPFLSSIETVSLLSFIKNLTSFMIAEEMKNVGNI